MLYTTHELEELNCGIYTPIFRSYERFKNYHSIDDLFQYIKTLPLATIKHRTSTCFGIPQQQQSEQRNKLVLKLSVTRKDMPHYYLMHISH